ncbi:Transcription factor IIS, N-terminal [Phaffia rhodozyma]|uniref:Transcription factor IIS, N-terminal n=1 Tax=Phaffia rhodozyma TaxID=264483 RepID=A0A0F7SN00_PHARH|nr:Transcription factor IIS, N-terminal [Phaffia rhodozyma]
MAGPASKKGSSVKKTEGSKFEVGDTVLCKMRGYPAWPGKIVSDDSIGDDVKRERPSKGQFWCIRFFPKGDHSWAQGRDLSHLTSAAIKEYVNSANKKAGELLEGYKVAGDPTDWEAEQDELSRQAKMYNENLDELDDDEDEPSSTGKRKKAASNGEKKAKKAKVEKKPKSDATPKSAKNTKKNGKVKSAANLESEDEAEGDKPKEAASKKSAGVSNDQSSLEADAQKVKDWRHKLQRGFLGKLPPQEKDMPQCHEYFNTIEAYDSMTVEQLQTSKIGKVMRKIAALDNIPNETKYNFKERASKLMGKWQTQLPSGSAAEEAGTPTNGASTSKKATAPESTKSKSDDKPKSKSKSAAPESESKPVSPPKETASEEKDAAPEAEKEVEADATEKTDADVVMKDEEPVSAAPEAQEKVEEAEPAKESEDVPVVTEKKDEVAAEDTTEAKPEEAVNETAPAESS